MKLNDKIAEAVNAVSEHHVILDRIKVQNAWAVERGLKQTMDTYERAVTTSNEVFGDIDNILDEFNENETKAHNKFKNLIVYNSQLEMLVNTLECIQIKWEEELGL